MEKTIEDVRNALNENNREKWRLDAMIKKLSFAIVCGKNGVRMRSLKNAFAPSDMGQGLLSWNIKVGDLLFESTKRPTMMAEAKNTGEYVLFIDESENYCKQVLEIYKQNWG